MENNNNNEYIDDDNELIEESQGRNKYTTLFMGLGILLFIALAAVIYFLLKEAPPPVKVSSVENIIVEHRKFQKPIKEIDEVLPMLPKVIKGMEKITLAPKVYKSKIIKSGGGKLDISQDDKQKSKAEKVLKEEKKTKKGYRGGISTVAGVHQYNQNLSLARGTLMPCNLDTRMISMVEGQVSCTLAEDVYSVNGNVLLLEKGSTAIGSYKSEGLKNGMNRMYVIWDDVRTPNNVIVSIGSGTSDELGSAGMVGEVDNHWGMRFGGAILVSLIDDGMAMFVQKQAQNQGGYIINTSSENTRSMSSQILSQYINIPPTLYKNQGDLINIYVNKDIDFSEVYALEGAR